MPRADHFAFLVSDLDAAIEFYGNVLGLKLLSRDRDDELGEEFAFFALEGGNLELLAKQPKGSARPALPVGNCPHLALASDDLDADLKRLRSHGVEQVSGPHEIPGLSRWFYFQDPDGNVLEYVQWIEGS